MTLLYQKPVRGFTLVETMVAISILAVAIVGPFVSIQNALTASYAARDQLSASMLAQEGIEYVRAVRDGNFIYNVANPSSPRSWFYGLDSTGGVNCVDPNPNDATARNCVVDPLGTTPVALCASFGAGACGVLYQIPSSFLYTQQSSGNVATSFTRKVTLASVSATEMRVTVTVTFTSGHKPYTVTISEILSNWI